MSSIRYDSGYAYDADLPYDGGTSQPVTAPSSTVPVITYLFCDLAGNVLAELPLNSFKGSLTLNGSGSWSATLQVEDPRVLPANWLDATHPYLTTMYVDLNYGQQILYGGIVQTRRYNRSKQQVQLGGSDHWSYFGQRVQAVDYSTTWATATAGAAQIAEQVMSDVLAVSYSMPIAIGAPAATPTEYQVNLSLPLSQLPTCDSIVNELQSAAWLVGFDYAIDCGYQTGVPYAQVTLSYPRRGVTQADGSTLIVDLASAIDWEYDEDGTGTANTQYQTATSGGGVQATVIWDPALVADGYPLLEQVQSSSQISSSSSSTSSTTPPAVLQAQASGQLAVNAYPVVAPQVVIPMFAISDSLGLYPQITDYHVGDDIQIVCDALTTDQQQAGLAPPDPRFPDGLNFWFRIVQIDMNIPDQGVWTSTLTLNVPPTTIPVQAPTGAGSIIPAPPGPADETAPDAPTSVSAVAQPGAAVVTFTVPDYDGGSPILTYTATSTPGSVTATSGGSPVTVTGLTNGTAYSFTVTATNAIGTSAPSGASNTVTPASSATAPAAPTITEATVGNGRLIVSFAPGATGGDPIIGYTVTASPGAITATGTASPITVTGLTNGTGYTLTATATNAVGTSGPSAGYGPVTPATTPGPVTGLAASAGNGQVTVTFTAPTSTGGSPITGYQIATQNPQAQVSYSTVPGSPGIVTGLTNGVTYQFRVSALNAVGAGTTVGPVTATPEPSATVPGAPTIGEATAGVQQATVTFTAPSSTGGDPITGYTVTSTPGSVVATGTGSPIVVTGLTAGVSYTFKVTATNAVGTGPASTASNPVTPAAPASVPGAPTGVTATAGNRQATVTFTPPSSTGGDPILSYTATSTPGGISVSGPASPIVVTGLTNGDSYTFKVTATNAVGTGPASTASNPVTPEGSTGTLVPDPGTEPLAFSNNPAGITHWYTTTAQLAAANGGTLPVASNSAGSTSPGTTRGLVAAFVDACSGGGGGIDFPSDTSDGGPARYVVDSSNTTLYPSTPVTFTGMSGNPSQPSGLVIHMPVPVGAVTSGSTDHEMVIYDTHTGNIWEMWEMIYDLNSDFPGWSCNSCCYFTNVNGTSGSTGVAPVTPTTATWSGTAFAAGLSAEALIMKVLEVQNNLVRHCLNMGLQLAGNDGGLAPPVNPALHSDGHNSTSSPMIPEGTRYVLPTSAVLPGPHAAGTFVTPIEKYVFAAVQEYGVYISDYAGSPGFGAETADTWVAAGLPDPWYPLRANYQTTLKNAISSSDQQLTITGSLPAQYQWEAVIIENPDGTVEYISTDNQSGSILNVTSPPAVGGPGRGVRGTTAVAHAAGATVYAVPFQYQAFWDLTAGGVWSQLLALDPSVS